MKPWRNMTASAALPVSMVEKPWGRTQLPPPFFSQTDQKIGEIWFESPADLRDLLVKYIFTSEKLSVQVHPSDAQTRAAGLGQQGKEECWLIIAADAGATIGIGFDAPLATAAMRDAALDGSIEQLMRWYPVSAGDFFYIPSGTVHAIGAGVSLIEIQQNSDITYRLFDYGRPRELHLDAGLAVAKGEVYDGNLHRKLPEIGSISVVTSPYFRLDRVMGRAGAKLALAYASGPVMVIPLTDSLEIGGETISAGECAMAQTIDAVQCADNALWLAVQPCERPA
ncbi:MAG: hypothetical protein RLY97_706 [Pseudomonadota bacterium]